MKKLIVSSFLLLSSVAFAQQSGNPTFSLTIVAESRHVKPGQDIFFTIAIRNLSDHPVACSRAPVSGSLDLAFQYDVRTSDGLPVKRITKTGAATGEHFSVLPCQLEPQPQGYAETGATIRAQDFDIGLPGEYTIRVAQYDPEARETVLSNQLTVTVDPNARPDLPTEAPKPGLYLQLPDKLDVLSDDDLDVPITWDNVEHQIIDCTPKWGLSHINEAFVYDVETSDGKPVPRLPVHGQEPSSSAEQNKPCDLGPRTFLSYGSLGPLMKAFDMRHPGNYTVQVSLPDPAHPGKILAVSNVLEVTVKDPPPGPPLELILSPDKVAVAPDGKFELRVKWINRSGVAVSCSPGLMDGGIDEAFTYDVRDSNGMPVPRAPKAETGGIYGSTGIGDFCTVGPGRNAMERSLGDLMRAFEMKKPGVYTVRVWRQANFRGSGSIGPDTITVVSNMVTVTVDEDAPPLALVFSPDHITASVRQELGMGVGVTLFNQSASTDVNCDTHISADGVDDNYTYDVKTSDGKPVPRLHPGNYRLFSTKCELQPGRSTQVNIPCLMCAFDTRKPGEYTVKMTRPDPSRPGKVLGTSNTLTITVNDTE